MLDLAQLIQSTADASAAVVAGQGGCCCRGAGCSGGRTRWASLLAGSLVPGLCCALPADVWRVVRSAAFCTKD